MLPNSCRVCLNQNKKLTSLYSEDEYEESPREMLMKVTGIQLEQEQEILEAPKQICRNCVCELNLAYQFRQKALEAQAVIDMYCRRQVKDSTREKIVVTINKATEIPQLNSNVDKAVEILEVDFDIDYTLLNSTEDYSEHCAIKKEPMKPSKRKFSKKKVQIEKSAASEANKLDWKNGRVISKHGRKPKSPGEENNAFICDICGNMFSKRSRLTEHRYRHETELRHSCELCGERFLMREMLRRHMFLHLGEKPYKCSYCSRTFFYKSVKKTHEAVHAGYKPYVCSQCDRAFAYRHALKKHELIHADIKLFHCKYCNKDFRLQHHLKQHEKTALHINAVRAIEKLILNKIPE